MGYAIYRMYKISKAIRPKALNLNNIDHTVDISKTAEHRRNCTTETHSCLTDGDCNSICAGPPSSYLCNEKKLQCEQISVETTPINAMLPTSTTCDAKKGFLNVVSVSELFGVQVSCIDTLPAYYDEDGNLYPHVCHGGSFHPDPNAGYSQYDTCKCAPGDSLVLKDTNPAPRCIPTKYLYLYPSFREI